MPFIIIIGTLAPLCNDRLLNK